MLSQKKHLCHTSKTTIQKQLELMKKISEFIKKLAPVSMFIWITYSEVHL